MESSAGAKDAVRSEDWLSRSPSRAYKEAISAPVYRLSELIFGSLVAAYILGFVSFAGAASHGGTVYSSVGELLGSLALPATYLLTSVTYAYVTAALYVSYHASVLALPSLLYKEQVKDFWIAIVQAGLYGIAMLLPASLLGTVGLVWLMGAVRKRGAMKGLARHLLKDQSGSRSGNFDPSQELLTCLRINRVRIRPLDGWIPGSIGMPVAMVAVGAVLTILDVFNRSAKYQVLEPSFVALGYCFVSMVVALVTIIVAARHLRLNSDLLADEWTRTQIDAKYAELRRLLSERPLESER